MSESSEPNAGDQQERARRVRRVIDDCLSRRASGEEVSDQSVIETHPDLLPELAEELRKLRLIEVARDKAQRRQRDEERDPPTPAKTGAARFRDTPTCRPTGPPLEHPHGIVSIAFSPHGRDGPHRMSRWESEALGDDKAHKGRGPDGRCLAAGYHRSGFGPKRLDSSARQLALARAPP